MSAAAGAQNEEALGSLQRLLGQLGVQPPERGCLAITGADPVVPSRHRLGLANAVAAAAQAATVQALWAGQTGRIQKVSVDVEQAAYPGLCTYLHIRQNGVPVHFPGTRGTPAYGFFRTRDGRMMYILRTPSYLQHFLKLHAFLKVDTRREAMAEAVAGWDALELEEALAGQGLMGAIAREQGEWLAHPQGRLLAGKPPVEVTRIGDAAARSRTGTRRPLDGLKVLDGAHVLAGPVTSRILAEQGAQVLRVSANHQPDDFSVTLDSSFGKRHAHLDLDRAEERAQLGELLREADVFVQSWRPGAMDRRGFGPEEVARLRPGIIYVSVSCYGDEGPWGTRGGYDPFGQVVSGLAISEGSAERPQLAATFTLNDYLTAYLAAAGVGSALLRQRAEGGSWHVRASLTQSSMWLLDMGRLPPEEWPDGTSGVARFRAPPDSFFASNPSAYGELRYPLPIARYEETPGFWEQMPEPPGASRPRWS